MLYVYCDSCRKNIPAPRSGVTFVTMLEKDLCIPCAKKLEQSVNELMAKEKTFHMDAFNKNRKIVLSRVTK